MFLPRRITSIACALGLAGALLAMPAFAQAPDPATLASARALMAASGADRGLDQIVPNFLEESRRVIIQTRPELDKPLIEATEAIAPRFIKKREELLNTIASFYARRFTKAELDQVTAFYSSETGKKMVALLPGAIAETREFLQTWTRQLSTDLMTSLREEMKKRGYEI